MALDGFGNLCGFDSASYNQHVAKRRFSGSKDAA
jgi:hypothetical protein